MPEYSLPLNNSAQLARARRWLILGVLALGVAGVFAGMLADTKSAFFYDALVVHVDLSEIVWFLTIACMFFTLATQGKGITLLPGASFGCFTLGTVLIACSAFTKGEPFMSDYVPVIHHPVFFVGLSLLICGVLGTAVNLIASGGWQKQNVPLFAAHSAAWIMLVALSCFVWSQQAVSGVTGQAYYEYIFWGGGHVLQFVHTQFMVLCWLWLAGAAGVKIALTRKQVTLVFCIGLLAALAAPVIYMRYDPMSDEHHMAFTSFMRDLNGLAPLIVGVALVLGWRKTADARVVNLPKVALFMSMLLFGAGGVLGYLIGGSNVVVPAHYHGSIVGITLAYMGVSYLLMPAFGWADPGNSRLARWQPVIYGGGQLCWMAGMAMLGEAGVARKTPGSADMAGHLAAFLKHGGDGLALIGGLLFVFVVLRAVVKRNSGE